MSSVSYTHLDVYKRQVRSLADVATDDGAGDRVAQWGLLDRCETTIQGGLGDHVRCGFCRLSKAELGPSLRRAVQTQVSEQNCWCAVSYTHLDVYKRQVRERGRSLAGHYALSRSRRATQVKANMLADTMPTPPLCNTHASSTWAAQYPP